MLFALSKAGMFGNTFSTFLSSGSVPRKGPDLPAHRLGRFGTCYSGFQMFRFNDSASPLGHTVGYTRKVDRTSCIVSLQHVHVRFRSVSVNIDSHTSSYCCTKTERYSRKSYAQVLSRFCVLVNSKCMRAAVEVGVVLCQCIY